MRIRHTFLLNLAEMVETPLQIIAKQINVSWEVHAITALWIFYFLDCYIFYMF